MNTTIHDGLPAQYTRTVNSNKNHEIYFYFFFKKKKRDYRDSHQILSQAWSSSL